MKFLRQFCAVTVLTFALTLSAFAGNMATGAVPPPPPPPASVTGNMATGVTATNEPDIEIVSIDPVTEFTLNILQGLLSLF